MEAEKITLWYWLAAIPMALLISWWPVGCEPEPAHPKSGGGQDEAAVLMAQKQAAADVAVVELEKVYARMSDSEQLRGDAEVGR
jgi:hypothetical protein